MSPPPSDRYRPDIDGLRAVAVLLVVHFHAFPEAVPGGFIGVDIFFVISGFLITGIVARELGFQKFSLLAFYDRRVRRIFPALIVVLCAVMMLGWLWLLPEAYAGLSVNVFASAAFAANIALLLQSGYFDIESARKPLLHLWSLGIEEQFYLVWPLILMLAARARLSLVWVVALLGIASFVLNIVLIGTDPVATFYLPFTRAFELLAGAALACVWGRLGPSGAASNWRAGLGIVLIAVAAAILDPRRAFPGWWAVLPVAGSALVLSAPSAWTNRHLLASRPFVWVGLISYPLYLWHWPLLVFLTAIKFRPLTPLERELIVVLSIALAWATYRFIETPFRFGRPVPIKTLGLCGAMALTAVAAGIVCEAGGFEFRLPAEIRALADVPEQTAQWRIHRCLLDLSHETSFADDCVDRNRRPLVMVWGDSTAGALMPGLRRAQQTHDFGIAQFTSSSCIPALDADIAGVPNCRAINDQVLGLAQRLQPDIVLLHGAFEKYLDHVAETVTALKQQTHARVVVLGPVPGWKRGLPNEVLRYFMLHHRLIPDRSDDAVSSNGYDAVMRAALVPKGAEFMSAWDALCNERGCLTRTGAAAGDITASDQVHLTEKGSIFLVQSIIDPLLGVPATPAALSSQ
ncbi:acyltransferase family protein [Bradyrhizobium sp.]|uniref:acyltransferase family protein n=1 Tax=Bradyrhizobium sp. TaxID=376 RepID=UPI003C5C2B95